MKKLVIIFGVLIAGSPFVSCKKLKDDIKDLQSQVNDLGKQNDTLKNNNAALKEQLDGIANVLGTNEPMTVSTNYKDDNGGTRTVSGVYKFKSSDYQTQRLMKNNDGTYDVFVARFGDITTEEYAYFYFTYNPSTKAVTDISGAHNWENSDPYNDRIEYYGGYSGLTMNVTVDSLNTTTGATSLKFSASGTDAYTNAISQYDSPNQGTAVSSNFSFVGKLKLFTTN
jgi:hypothetical protein